VLAAPSNRLSREIFLASLADLVCYVFVGFRFGNRMSMIDGS